MPLAFNTDKGKIVSSSATFNGTKFSRTELGSERYIGTPIIIPTEFRSDSYTPIATFNIDNASITIKAYTTNVTYNNLVSTIVIVKLFNGTNEISGTPLSSFLSINLSTGVYNVPAIVLIYTRDITQGNILYNSNYYSFLGIGLAGAEGSLSHLQEYINNKGDISAVFSVNNILSSLVLTYNKYADDRDFGELYFGDDTYYFQIINIDWINGYDKNGTQYTTMDLLFSSGTIVDINNPYSGGGMSGTGGGGGTYDDSSDTIDFPSEPVISAIQTGFVSMYCPSLSQIQALGAWLWSGDIPTNLQKLFGNPMQAIIGLSLCPVRPSTRGSTSVKLGNIDSGITMPAVSDQYVTVDCGSVSLREYYGAAVDYSPYTQVQLYVPYCGIYSIDIDDVMSGICNLKYQIDVMSGACSAMLKCAKNTLSSVLYNFSGNVNTNIPVTSADWSQLIRSVISVSAAGVAAAVTAGASVPATAAGSAAGAVTTTAAGGVMGSAVSSLGNVKPSITRGGNVSTAIGSLSVQTPYFILSRPVQSIPDYYEHYSGLPANITKNLSEVSGFTTCENVFIDLATATNEEKAEIETLLKGGIIL